MEDSGTLYLRAAAMTIMTMTDGYYHDGGRGIDCVCVAFVFSYRAVPAFCLAWLGWVGGFRL